MAVAASSWASSFSILDIYFFVSKMEKMDFIGGLEIMF